MKKAFFAVLEYELDKNGHRTGDEFVTECETKEVAISKAKNTLYSKFEGNKRAEAVIIATNDDDFYEEYDINSDIQSIRDKITD